MITVTECDYCINKKIQKQEDLLDLSIGRFDFFFLNGDQNLFLIINI